MSQYHRLFKSGILSERSRPWVKNNAHIEIRYSFAIKSELACISSELITCSHALRSQILYGFFIHGFSLRSKASTPVYNPQKFSFLGSWQISSHITTNSIPWLQQWSFQHEYRDNAYARTSALGISGGEPRAAISSNDYFLASREIDPKSKLRAFSRSFNRENQNEVFDGNGGSIIFVSIFFHYRNPS